MQTLTTHGKVHYIGSTQPALRRGGAGGNLAQFTLDKDEWITKITGTHAPSVISSLSFRSNRGSRLRFSIREAMETVLILFLDKWGPYGTIRGTKFVMSAEGNVKSPLSEGMGFLYFQGNRYKQIHVD